MVDPNSAPRPSPANHSRPPRGFNPPGVGAHADAFRAARPDLAEDVAVRPDGLLLVTPRGFSEFLSWAVDGQLLTHVQARDLRGQAERQARGAR